MIIGKIVGNVWATRKEESLNGLKLLIVKPIDHHSGQQGNSLVAVDNVGAGKGDIVLVVGGSSARRALSNQDAPIDATIVGIVDEVEVDKSL